MELSEFSTSKWNYVSFLPQRIELHVFSTSKNGITRVFYLKIGITWVFYLKDWNYMCFLPQRMESDLFSDSKKELIEFSTSKIELCAFSTSKTGINWGFYLKEWN